ncbi:hypothetical protein [Kordiimonas sp.]|uniref:hypothetical protein n=1 Tax=Kordiimonas sp. TaxID=1970157 RepID=UPI003A952AE8
MLSQVSKVRTLTWLEFFSSIVASLAWPLAIIVALVIFKDPILQAIPRLQRIRYKELVAEFNKGLDKIERQAEAAGLKQVEHTEDIEDFEEHLQQIAQVSTNAAIVEAFRQIEKAAKALIKANGSRVDYKVAAPYRMIERLLREYSLLDTREVKIFHDLRILRNKITHSENFESTASQANEYIELASRLISKLEKEAAKISTPNSSNQ